MGKTLPNPDVKYVERPWSLRTPYNVWVFVPPVSSAYARSPLGLTGHLDLSTVNKNSSVKNAWKGREEEAELGKEPTTVTFCSSESVI